MNSTIVKTLLVICTLALVPATARCEGSLYDAGNAQKLSKFPLLNLGPNSSSIRYDKRMIRAAEIARQRARSHSVRRCWSYVKNALLAADVIDSRPTTGYAKQAGGELLEKYGFKRIFVRDPYKAPVGSVLVYGGRGAGHVELRTEGGFVSDFVSKTPSKRPLIGVYVKPKQG
jgi:hypothetical protein